MSIIQEALKKAHMIYAKEIVKETSIQKPGDISGSLAPQKTQSALAPFIKLVPGTVLLILIAAFGLNSFLSKHTAGAPNERSHQDVSYKPVVKDAALGDPFDAGSGIQAQVITSPIKSPISSGTAFVNAPDLELNGIMYLEERPRAIINGNIVEVGESVSGARVDAIKIDSVLLNYNDLEITLRLK
ncbi:MAG: hypothetical protein WC419_00820 [Candidatus Omnitrophota bacterium]|nr:hypothetical protein [Candidatus Omnitrophota bacterium]